MASPVEQLMESLEHCVPLLDPAPLRADAPAGVEQGAVLGWLAGHLEQQGLLVYEEWKEYFGHVPELRQLSTIDFSGFDSGCIVSMAGEIDEDQIPEELMYSMPYEMPYLEYLNAFLKKHGLRVVDLLPFENAYMIAVKDDAPWLERLDQCLQRFDMGINPRDPMDEQEAKAYLDRLLSTGA